MESVQTAVRQGLDKGTHLQKMCVCVFKVTILDILPHGRMFTTSTVATIDQLGSPIIAGIWCNFIQTFQELLDLCVILIHSRGPRHWEWLRHQNLGHKVVEWRAGICAHVPQAGTPTTWPPALVWSLLQVPSLAHYLRSETNVETAGGRSSKYYFLSVFLETYNLIFFKHFSYISQNKLEVVVPIPQVAMAILKETCGVWASV